MSEEIRSLPTVALRGMTILPGMAVHFDISRNRSIEAIQEAMLTGQEIFLITQQKADTQDPKQEDLYEIGTVASVRQIIKLPKNIFRVLVSGEMRGENRP